MTAGLPLLKVNDIELYYESHGTGDPLVLIGGLGLAVAEMRSLINALAAGGYRVIAADNRGAGRSAKPPGPYTIGQMAGDVAGLLTRIGVERAHVLGISMGGRVALALALDHPKLVDHLITQPTLIVHGRADRIAPVALAREMHEAIPSSRLALHSGGHLISLLPHRQQQFVATVLGFLPPSKPPSAA